MVALSCYFEPCGPNSSRFHVFKNHSNTRIPGTSFRFIFSFTYQYGIDRLSTCRAFPWSPWHPSLVVEIALDCRCNYRDCSENCRRLKWQFNCHGWPQNAIEIAVAIAVDLRDNSRVSEDCCGWPWKLLWFDVRGNGRGSCRGLPWYLPRIGGLPWQWLWMAVKIAVV